MNTYNLADGLEAFGLAWRYTATALQFLIDKGSSITSGGGGPSPGGIATLTTFLMGAYVLMKNIDILGKAEGGVAARLEAAWYASRKGMIVYALSVAAPAITLGLATLAIGNVQKAAKVIPDAVEGVLNDYDKLLGSGSSMFVTAPVSAMYAFGLQNSVLDVNKAKALAAQSENNVTALLGIYDAHAATLTNLGKVAMRQGPGGAQGAVSIGAAMGQNVSALRGAAQDFQKGVTAQAESASLGKLRMEQAKSVGKGALMELAAPGIAGAFGSGIGGGIAESLKMEMKDVAKYIGCYVAGWALVIIAMLGIAGGGMAVIKEGFGALAYLLGVMVAMTIGTAVVIPFSGLFMLAFLSEKTDVYGRNFVSFLFSMVFASLGLKAAATVVAGFLGLVGSVGVSAAALLLGKICVGDGSMVGAAFGCAGVALGVGMFTSFIIEVLKRGGAIGAGVWSGSLQV